MSDQFAGGDGGGSLPYETTDDLDSHGTINRYHKRGHGYVDRVQARYTNDSDESTEIEVAFAVPEGSKIVEWLLPDDAEETTRAPQAIIANLPDESFDQQDILSRQEEFDFYSYDVNVPSQPEDEVQPGRVRCGVEIESELGQENELGVWILGSFAGGSGSSSDPYLIENWNHLDNVRDNLNDSFELVNDLDSETAGYDDHASETANDGDGWEPIGDDDNRFEGTFDGQGYEIADPYIDRPNTEFVGLFGYNDGTIENVGVIQVDVTGDRRVGSLVGVNNSEVTDSYSTGEVSGDSDVGGLVGANTSEVTGSYSTGDVSGDSEVGGLVGLNADTVTDSYSTGEVSGDFNFGGLVGQNFGTVTDSYWDTESSGQDDSDGGTGLTTDEMQGDSPLVEMDGFDFDDTWEVVEQSDFDAVEDGYPILQSIDRQTQLESQGIYGVFFTGKVTQDDNVENATVVAVNLDTDGFEGITTTDANGEYEFELDNLDDLPYEILVAVDYEDSGGDRFGRTKTILFDP